jgi:hypothetical protein
MHGRRAINIGFWWVNQKKREYYEGLNVDGRIILNLMLEK